MTAQPPSELNKSIAEQKEAITQTLKWKYLFIGVVIVALLIILVLLKDKPWEHFKTVIESLLYAGFGALLSTLFYDWFVHAQQGKLIKLERAQFADEFAKELFSTYLETSLNSDALGRVISDKKRRRDVINCLASIVASNNGGLTESVEKAYFAPLQDPPRFHSVRTTSRLYAFDNAQKTYSWKCSQTAKTIGQVNEFKIFVCSDSNISGIVESSRAADLVILLSEFDKNTIGRWLDDSFEIEVSSFKGGKHSLTTSNDDRLGNLNRCERCENITEDQGAFRIVTWPSQDSELMIEIEFSCKLSLAEDPFFLWNYNHYQFVEHLSIDYSELKQHCGTVSAFSFISNSAIEFKHKRNSGVFEVDTLGLVGPGDGAAIMLRPK